MTICLYPQDIEAKWLPLRSMIQVPRYGEENAGIARRETSQHRQPPANPPPPMLTL